MTVPPSPRFTYDDYLLLPEDKRYEIIDGDLFPTPAPTPYHQLVSKRILIALDGWVQKNRLGEVYFAPCDVVLSSTNVVQPDILFVAAERASIAGERYVSQAPDLVVEVLSTSTADRDRTLKRQLYARFGVREVWIADPKAKSVEVLAAHGEDFLTEAVFRAQETLRSALLPGLEIPLADVFR